MTARLAQGGTSWDDMLDAAVLQGLTAAPGEETSAPNQWRLTSGAEDGEDADAADANDAEDAEDDLEELHGSLAHEVSASLQAATARFRDAAAGRPVKHRAAGRDRELAA